MDDDGNGACHRLASARKLREAGEMLMRNAWRLEVEGDAFDREKGKYLEELSQRVQALASEVHCATGKALRSTSVAIVEVEQVVISKRRTSSFDAENRKSLSISPSLIASCSDPLGALGVTAVMVDLDGTSTSFSWVMFVEYLKKIFFFFPEEEEV